MVEIVANGLLALNSVRDKTFDLILMDCQMPVMDGYLSSQKIRALGPPYSELPIIAVTAHALQGDRNRCLAVGMDDYVSKPIKMESLLAAMARCLNDPRERFRRSG